MSLVQTLGTACLYIVDCEHKTAPIDEAGEYFAVGTPAMRGNVINYGESRRVNKRTFEAWTRRLLPQSGDLLFAREAPVGPIVRIPDTGVVAPGQRTVLLRPNPKIVDSNYLFYFLSSPIQQDLISAKSSGSTVDHLNVADVRNFELSALPPILAQQAVAEVLGALDDKIACNAAFMQTTEDLVGARFAALHLDEEPEPGERVMILDDLIELNPQVSASIEAEPVYVDMQKLPVAGMSIVHWTCRPAKGGTRFQNGDTLLARITPCLQNRKTGYVDFLDEGQVAVGSTEYIVMRSRPGVPSGLSFFLAVSDRFRSFAIRRMVGTSGRQRLSAGDIRDYRLRVADPASLETFGRAAEPLIALVKSRTAESRTLTAMREALLPQLMSGKIRVKDAEQMVGDVV